MKREELLKSNEYWMVQIQNDLYGIIKEYMNQNDLNQTQLADKLKVTKGYVSQVLKGSYDHKISKLVDLALKSGYVPLLYFVNTNIFLQVDSKKMYYEIYPTIRPESIRISPSKFNHSYVDLLSLPTVSSSISVASTN
jgi:transcriptional regulator with XRE-family HTH domain